MAKILLSVIALAVCGCATVRKPVEVPQQQANSLSLVAKKTNDEDKIEPTKNHNMHGFYIISPLLSEKDRHLELIIAPMDGSGPAWVLKPLGSAGIYKIEIMPDRESKK